MASRDKHMLRYGEFCLQCACIKTTFTTFFVAEPVVFSTLNDCHADAFRGRIRGQVGVQRGLVNTDRPAERGANVRFWRESVQIWNVGPIKWISSANHARSLPSLRTNFPCCRAHHSALADFWRPWRIRSPYLYLCDMIYFSWESSLLFMFCCCLGCLL